MSTVDTTQKFVPHHELDVLTEDEIKAFVDELEHNDDGHIAYAEVERKLDAVHREIAPKPLPHNLHHQSRDAQVRHAFLQSITGTQSGRLSRREFEARVRDWQIPSMKQDEANAQTQKKYMRSLPRWRRFRSWWSVRGPRVLFIILVIGFELAFGLWQMIKYITQVQYRAAFGWGVVLAKSSAGFLYPTMFLLLLSMSRYFSTILRRSYRLSWIIDWDVSQAFHVKMSILSLALATLHAIGHLSGSFVFGSRTNRQEAVADILGPDAVPRPYHDYAGSLPGFTGISALSLLYILAALSLPSVRRFNYEVFQLGHLLMFPIIGLLMAHGTAHLLQFPMLGYFLAFPTLLIVIERATRVAIGFRRISAQIQLLDEQTLELQVTIPPARIWTYQAGQYVFLQVPSISFWQWHPFTVSECIDKKMSLHIKIDGKWTTALREMVKGKRAEIQVGLDGPYGAPAQRFYDFNHTILVGSGIGVTPFSGILTDLQAKCDQLHGGPCPTRQLGEKQTHPNNPISRSVSRSRASLSRQSSRFQSSSQLGSDYRRVDFHWTVRDRNHLLWFSDLLNKVTKSQIWHRDHDRLSHLDIRIQTHVTQKRKNITTHVYRWLLEKHRTEEHPESPLTGLLNPTHYGRPDFVRLLDAHYEDMVKFMSSEAMDKLKVGVFFCGASIVGEILADRCRLLTARGAVDGRAIQYVFMTEVFG